MDAALRPSRLVVAIGGLLVLVMSGQVNFAREATDTISPKESPPAISADEPFATAFSLELAHDYLEQAAAKWTRSQQCITCHTNGLFLLSGRADSEVLRETQRFARTYLAPVVTAAADAQHPDRSIESIVAPAALLAISESRASGRLDATTRRALDYIWTRLSDKGCWDDWLKCNWPPYEVDDHFGVTLVAVAMGMVAEQYRVSPAARGGLDRLRQYLAASPAETPHQRGMLLWASTVTRGILTADEQRHVMDELLKLQRDDGGWNLISLGPSHRSADVEPDTWIRTDGSRQDSETSDGYATGFVVFVLRQAGVPAGDPRLQRAVVWLKRNQRASGRWFTRSPRRDGQHYISNAGSSFAVLALESCGEDIRK